MHTHTRARGRLPRKPAATACLLVSSSLGLAAAAPAQAQAQAEAGEQPGAVSAAARKHVLAGRSVPVKGRLASGESGRTVAVQVRTDRGWKTVDRARTRGGRYSAAWRPAAPGRFALRVRVAGSPATSEVDKVTAYRAAPASWYGPGFYGRRTACGQTLTTGMVGVAHKSLPCGTRVTLRYRGRSATVPVIDRGPYAGNRVYDLTAATKQKLGFGSTGTVWSSK